jgi:hypothetical protein
MGFAIFNGADQILSSESGLKSVPGKVSLHALYWRFDEFRRGWGWHAFDPLYLVGIVVQTLTIFVTLLVVTDVT